MAALTRTLPVNGGLIARWRKDKDVSPEDMGAEASCSGKTILNLERGGPAFRTTLRRVAKAMGLDDYRELVRDDDDSEDDRNDERETEQGENLGSIRLWIVIDGPFHGFCEATDLPRVMKRLREIINAQSRVVVMNVRPGSVVVDLLVAEGDALRLLKAYMQGELVEIGVSKLKMNVAVQDGRVIVESLSEVSMRLSSDDWVPGGGWKEPDDDPSGLKAALGILPRT